MAITLSTATGFTPDYACVCQPLMLVTSADSALVTAVVMPVPLSACQARKGRRLHCS